MRLPVGTRSLLYGSHQVVLHPIFVAVAWRRLYGRWPRDPRIWVAIVVHDWGYWGCPDMDGRQGEAHPLRGANLLGRLFDRHEPRIVWDGRWWRFAAGHSRTFAARLGIPTSPLMQADKLGTALYPRAIYALLCWLSGEWVEYRDRWVAAGTYPGRADDGAWAYCGHIQANWQRFRDPAAVAGRAYGGE